MRSPDDLTIPPLYTEDADFTASWGDRRHGDIFPAVYRRYRAPFHAAEAQQQIDELAEVITGLNSLYEQTCTKAIGLGIDHRRDQPTKDRLKQIRTNRNRHEAVRRAYIHWLATEQGSPLSLPELGVTQLSAKSRQELLGASVLRLVELYLADLRGDTSTPQLEEQLEQLHRELTGVFAVSPDAAP